MLDRKKLLEELVLEFVGDKSRFDLIERVMEEIDESLEVYADGSYAYFNLDEDTYIVAEDVETAVEVAEGELGWDLGVWGKSLVESLSEDVLRLYAKVERGVDKSVLESRESIKELVRKGLVWIDFYGMAEDLIERDGWEKYVVDGEVYRTESGWLFFKVLDIKDKVEKVIEVLG